MAHGEAAQFKAGEHVLDVACGNGASLTIWADVFAVDKVTALEWQAVCIEKIRRASPSVLAAVHRARFDALPLPAGLPEKNFGAVLCVDAAYHASSLAAFSTFEAATLKPGGRLAFSTLLCSPTLTGLQRGMVSAALQQAEIPAESFVCEVDLRQTLQAQGFVDIRVQVLDAAVLAGFADFVKKHKTMLSWRERLNSAWLKIAATAALCRWLYKNRYAHYVLVSATKEDER
jgi:cyclopropane fatty-acyl-phospholipid synthase-like methyltransferase